MKKILILFGGSSYEHLISCHSAKTVLENIDKKIYCVTAVGITQSNEWYIFNNDLNLLLDGNWHQKDDKKIENIIEYLSTFDKVFPIIHGNNGEDGTLSGLFDLFNIDYVGSNSLGHALGYDKEITKIICDHYNIPQVSYLTIHQNEKTKKINLDYPVIIKPAKCGSSIGINIAKNNKEFHKGLKTAFKYDTKVIVEKYITARELECGVLKTKNNIISSVGEIITKSNFYDYNAKYIDDTKTIIPAKINKHIESKIKEYTNKIFNILNLSNIARIDFLYDEYHNTIYFNEVNTIPGFTNISMYPLLFNNIGINIKELITNLIEY